MASAAEYRQYARGCLEWADKAENEAERKHFLSIARDTQDCDTLALQLKLDELIFPPWGSLALGKTKSLIDEPHSAIEGPTTVTDRRAEVSRRTRSATRWQVTQSI
jgi:hypothetical protein